MWRLERAGYRSRRNQIDAHCIPISKAGRRIENGSTPDSRSQTARLSASQFGNRFHGLFRACPEALHEFRVYALRPFRELYYRSQQRFHDQRGLNRRVLAAISMLHKNSLHAIAGRLMSDISDIFLGQHWRILSRFLALGGNKCPTGHWNELLVTDACNPTREGFPCCPNYL